MRFGTLPWRLKARRPRRVAVPTVLQMEAVECGAAALAMVLASFGRWVALEELRAACGVSRDGSKASNLLQAARKYGLIAAGYKQEPDELGARPLPMIVFWKFNHFIVVEGFRKRRVYVNDPASGPRVMSAEEFDEGFTGIALIFERGPDFTPGGQPPALLPALRRRLAGLESVVLFAVLAGLGLVVPGLAIPVFARIFVDDILINRMNDWLIPLLLAMGATAVLRAAFTIVQQEALLRMNTRMALTTSSRFVWHVLRLPMDFFNQRWAGDVSNRVLINDKVAQLLSGDLATNLVNVVTVVFYALVMLAYDSVLTVVGIGFAVLNVAALQFVSRKRVDLNRRLLKAQSQVAGTSAAGIQMAEDLKATGTESDFFVTWSGYFATLLNAQQGLAVYNAVLMSVPPLLSALNTVAILAVGGLRVMDGHLSVGMLVGFQSLMASFMGPIEQLVRLGGAFQVLQGDMARLDDVLRYAPDPQVLSDADTAEAPGNVVQLAGALTLENVTFGYSRLAPPLIENFNLVVRPGERVALVGGSGSGKSTIARLVSGLYEPWSGDVLFDGRRRQDIPRTVLNNSIALVDQDVFVFDGTIRDNLTLWDSTVLETAVTDGAHDAAIHDDIAARPGGYDSHVEEGGRNFSGGQRLRLEIARALAGNPTLIVLDEATSALDTMTEKLVDDSLRRRGCTCLIIAHRLSTIRDADEIVVLERGKVVQRGIHEELKHIEGPYKRLIGDEG